MSRYFTALTFTLFCAAAQAGPFRWKSSNLECPVIVAGAERAGTAVPLDDAQSVIERLLQRLGRPVGEREADEGNPYVFVEGVSAPERVREAVEHLSNDISAGRRVRVWSLDGRQAAAELFATTLQTIAVKEAAQPGVGWYQAFGVRMKDFAASFYLTASPIVLAIAIWADIPRIYLLGPAFGVYAGWNSSYAARERRLREHVPALEAFEPLVEALLEEKDRVVAFGSQYAGGGRLPRWLQPRGPVTWDLGRGGLVDTETPVQVDVFLEPEQSDQPARLWVFAR